MNLYNAIIFDMDGVLIDTEKYLTKFWCMAANEYGFNMQMQHALHIRSLSGVFAEKYLKSEFGNNFDYNKIRNRRRELMNEHLSKNGIEIKKGVKSTLEKIKLKGIKTAVATATDLERTQKYLKEVGIYQLFDNIICAAMVKNGKPMPDIYIYSCNLLGENPNKCIAVEDSPNGVISAYRAGCKVIMVPDLTLPNSNTKKMLYGLANTFDDIENMIY